MSASSRSRVPISAPRRTFTYSVFAFMDSGEPFDAGVIAAADDPILGSSHAIIMSSTLAQRSARRPYVGRDIRIAAAKCFTVNRFASLRTRQQGGLR
jgi:hypothetical protein